LLWNGILPGIILTGIILTKIEIEKKRMAAGVVDSLKRNMKQQFTYR
jgi:hypothetical protein